jgi:Flp pilus assembly protein protease CpaA
MERLRNLHTTTWLIAVLLLVELVMIVVMTRPVGGFFLWTSLGIVALMCCYLVRICLVLIKELKDYENKKDRR